MATLGDKAKLLRGLLTGQVAYGSPVYVTVDLTHRCNLRCLGCLYHTLDLGLPAVGDQSKQDIPYELVKTLGDELKQMGTKILVLSGEGEPFLHPRFSDIIFSAKQAGFQVILLTNGTLLDDKNVQNLIDAGLDMLRVSLWAGSPEDYARNYPGTNPTNYGKVIDGLNRLQYLKKKQDRRLPYVVLHQPVNRCNYQKVDTMIDLADETGCNALSFSPLKHASNGLRQYALSSSEERRLCDALTDMKEPLDALGIDHSIDQTLLRYRIGEAVWQEAPCYVAWVHARVRADGTVLACNQPCNIPLGNLNEHTFGEIWNGSAIRRFRRQTLSPDGLRALGKDCDCKYCCHILDNLRVHRSFKWFLPFVRSVAS